MVEEFPLIEVGGPPRERGRQDGRQAAERIALGVAHYTAQLERAAGFARDDSGEVKFAKGDNDEAAKFYQKAADTDPAWGKPWFKLGLVALNRGDKDTAAKMMDKTVAADPTSPEAAQAKGVIEQLKK